MKEKLEKLKVGDFIERVVYKDKYTRGEVTLTSVSVQSVDNDRFMVTSTTKGKVAFKLICHSQVRELVTATVTASDFQPGDMITELTYEDKGEEVVVGGFSVLSVYQSGVLASKQVDGRTIYKKFLYRNMVGA